MKRVCSPQLHPIPCAILGLVAVLLALGGGGCMHRAMDDRRIAGLQGDSRGQVQLFGKPFRGVGVNYYDVFQRQLGPHPRSLSELDEAFRVLREHRIPFVRFAACGYWPVDWRMYQRNRAEYFRRMAEVVGAAERQKVGLIPSLFWYQPTISDLVGEPFGAWGGEGSRTRAFMREYVREVVGRFHGSAAVWAWEFGNEFNLPADLPNAGEHRPAVVVELGTGLRRTAEDDLTHHAFRDALSEFGREVRRLDAHRLILSGNAFPRPSAWHQMHEKNWTRDTEGQWLRMLADDHPDPISGWTGRLYSEDDWRALRLASEAAAKSGKTLFIGEFGVPGELTPDKLREFDRMLTGLDTNQISLAAVWVYDFAGQEADWNVRAEGGRRILLDRVSERNREWNPDGVRW